MSIFKTAYRYFIIGVIALFPMRAVVEAYDAVSVENGATITGRVTFEGAPPPAEVFELVMSPDPDYCGKVSDGKGNRLLKSFIIGPDRGLKNVVMAIEGVQKGKPFTFKQPQVTTSTCRFFPFVTTVQNNRDIRVVNLDTVFHDIQAYMAQGADDIDQIFNAPLPAHRPITQPVKLTKNRRVFRMQCGIHAFMQDWGFAVENPYYDITRADGTFTIPDLLPGTYKIIAWHPLTNLKEQIITVEPNARLTVNFEYRADEARVKRFENPASVGGMSGKRPYVIRPNELQIP